MLSTPASVAELAEAWLTAKRANESAEQAEKGNSDRARRADLGRWALLIAEAVDHSPTADDAPPMKRLDLDDLSEDVLAAAIAAAKRRWSDATIARMLSTLRGFTRWLYRTGRITTDPLEGDVSRGPPRRERRPKALSEEDVERIRDAADEDPTGRQRMYWPTRDVALVRFLASTGARAEEASGATIGELDRRAERPIWRVRTSKGDKTRDVPLPKLTVEAIDGWLAERVRPAEGRRALKARQADPLFVRLDGTAFSVQALDRLVRGLAHRAGVVLPAGAAAHAFRHHYGVTLATWGAPGGYLRADWSR